MPRIEVRTMLHRTPVASGSGSTADWRVFISANGWPQHRPRLRRRELHEQCLRDPVLAIAARHPAASGIEDLFQRRIEAIAADLEIEQRVQATLAELLARGYPEEEVARYAAGEASLIGCPPNLTIVVDD